MKFAIVYEDHDYEYTQYVLPTSQPLPEAYEESYWKSDSFHPKSGFSLKAVLNKKGKPVIEQVPFTDPAPKGWYKKGRNHHEKDGVYLREIEQKAWFIDLNSLEELMDFLREHDASLWHEDSYTYERMPSLVYKPQKERLQDVK